MSTALELVEAWYAATAARERDVLRGPHRPEVEFIVADGYPAGRLLRIPRTRPIPTRLTPTRLTPSRLTPTHSGPTHSDSVITTIQEHTS